MAVCHSSKSKSTTDSACIDGIDFDAIDNALTTIAQEQQTHERPEGFTVAEYAEKKKIASRTAQTHLLALYKNDFAERTIWKNEDNKKAYVYKLKQRGK